MAEDQNRVEIEIGAKLDEISSALNSLGSRFDQFAKDTESKLSGLGGAFDKLKEKAKQLAEGLAIEEVMRRGIDKTLELHVASDKLARQLGITEAEASAIGVAMGDAYGTTDDYTHASQFLARQLKQNEDRLKELGVVTRDSSGHLLGFDKITMNAIATVNGYKQGTDRAGASTEIFGRAALNNQAILRLTQESLEEARQKADALGLTMTQVGADNAEALRKGIHEVQDVFDALLKVVGDALAPVLGDLAKWFADMGPTAVTLFRNALVPIVIVIDVVVAAFRALAEIVAGVIKVVFTGASTLINFWDKLRQGDVKGAVAAVAEGGVEIQAQIHDTIEGVRDAGKDLGKELYDALNPDPAKAGKRGDQGSRDYSAHLRSLVSRYDAELETMKAAQEQKTFAEGEYQKFTLQQERAFWSEKLKLGGLNTQETAAVTKKMMALDVQITREAFAAKLTALQGSQSLWNQNLQQQLYFATETARATEKASGGPQTKEAIAAWNAVAHIKQQIFEQDKKMAADRRALEEEEALHGVTMATRAMELERDLGHVSARDYIAVQEQMENRQYEIKRAGLERTRDIDKDDPNVSPEKKLQNDQAIEKLEMDHQLKITDIRRQAVLEAEKLNLGLQKSFQDSMTTMIEEMGTTVKSLNQLLNEFLMNLWRGFMRLIAQRFVERVFGAGTVGGQFIESLTKPISDGINKVLESFVGTQAAMTAAEDAEAADRAAAQAAASAETVSLNKATAADEIIDYAAAAAVAAMASVAAIPFVGWMMAPGVGMETLAEGMSYLGVLAAAKGTDSIEPGRPYLVGERGPELRTFDAPGSILPNEMLGGAVHLHVSAMDAQSVQRLFQQNGREIAKVLAQQVRNFNSNLRQK